MMVNPYPHVEEEEDPYLSASDLDRSERQLRDYLLKHRRELSTQLDESLGQATGRIVKLVTEGLTKTGAAWWSALQDMDVSVVEPPALPTNGPWQYEHIGPKPPPRPAQGCLWRDTSCAPPPVREYTDQRRWRVVQGMGPGLKLRDVRSLLYAQTDFTFRWPRLTALNEDIKIMLKDRMGRAGKSGRPAFLACAALSALLEVDTSKVVDLLANYRRVPIVSKRSG